MHPDHSDELFRVYKVAGGVQLKLFARGNYVGPTGLVGRMMLVKRGPGAEIVPTKRCRDTKDAGLAFAFLRARLKQGIVDADVFALGVERAKRLVEGGCAVAGSDLLEDEGCIG